MTEATDLYGFFQASVPNGPLKIIPYVCYKMFRKVSELPEEIFMYVYTCVCMHACKLVKKINRLVCI